MKSKEFRNRAAMYVVGGLGNILWYVSAFISTYRFVPKVIPLSTPGTGDSRRALRMVRKFLKPDLMGESEGSIARMSCVDNRWYQHKRWLIDKDIILNDVLDSNALDNVNTNIVDNYDLVIHHRGTDFKTSPVHTGCILKQADIDHVLDKLSASSKKYRGRKLSVLVVTDDYKDASAKYPDYSIIHNEDEAVDFAIMLKAKNLLIYPGSTFSYWAGYLGDHENVYLPAFNWPCANYDIYDLTSASISEDLAFPGATLIYSTEDE